MLCPKPQDRSLKRDQPASIRILRAPTDGRHRLRKRQSIRKFPAGPRIVNRRY